MPLANQRTRIPIEQLKLFPVLVVQTHQKADIFANSRNYENVSPVLKAQ